MNLFCIKFFQNKSYYSIEIVCKMIAKIQLLTLLKRRIH
jgi:hypothetical protein